ncbi:MAG: 2-dehydropantoate 2-reductase [Methyloceanibacter sp.]
MTIDPNCNIVVAGAGSVGCYLGGRLAAAGRNVTLLLRPSLAEAISQHGMRVSDLDRRDEIIEATQTKATSDAEAALRSADVVLVTVKAGDTASISHLIGQHAPKDAIVVSLQNGVENADILRSALAHRVAAGMVPFNVVQTRAHGQPPRFHRASSGTLQVEAGFDGLRDLLDVPRANFEENDDIRAVLWGKLLVNLNNGLNALSGLSLIEQLGDRRWRLLFSRQMREGLAVLRAAGIRAGSIEGVPPRLTAFALRLPDRLFRLASRRTMAFDRNARSSMWEDLQARRPTEIEFIQGQIVRLAGAHGLRVPLNSRVMHLIKEAETAGKGSPSLTPEAVGNGIAS